MAQPTAAPHSATVAPPIVYPPVSDAAKRAGMETIIGFGSLLSERSARSTFPTLHNFRPGLLKNYRRIFAHVAAIFIERGIADVARKKMSSLSVEPYEGNTVLVSVFEIPVTDLPAFFARETEFRWLHAPVYTPSGGQVDLRAIDGQGLICAAYTDHEYKNVRLGGSAAAFHEAYGRWGIDRVWRDDLLPCGVYLRHVVLSAAGMDLKFGSTEDDGQREEWSDGSKGDDAASSSHDASSLVVTPTLVSLPRGRVLSSFLDSTFLGDRRTTVRAYLRENPQVMLTQPPENLKERYSG